MSVEAKSATVIGSVVGSVLKLLFSSSLGLAVGVAFCTGAAAYAGQLIMKWAVKWSKGKIKSISIKFFKPKP